MYICNLWGERFNSFRIKFCKLLWCTPTSAATSRNDSCLLSSNSCLFKLSSPYWFLDVHFQHYEHQIFVIGSLQANSALLVELEIFFGTNCEKIFVLQLFHALDDTVLGTGQFSIGVLISWNFLVFVLWNIYQSGVARTYCCYFCSNRLPKCFFKNNFISTSIN